MDKIVLINALASAGQTDLTTVTYENVLMALDQYGYLKYSGDKLWDEWDNLNNVLKQKTADPSSGIVLDDLPTNDYVAIYKKDSIHKSYVINYWSI